VNEPRLTTDTAVIKRLGVNAGKLALR